MKMGLAVGALVAAMAVIAPTWHADAQSQNYSGGYASGGGSYRGAITSPGGITRNTPAVRVAPVVRPAPVVRSIPAVPPSHPVTNPPHGMSGSYQNNIGNVPPGTRATTVTPR